MLLFKFLKLAALKRLASRIEEFLDIISELPVLNLKFTFLVEQMWEVRITTDARTRSLRITSSLTLILTPFS